MSEIMGWGAECQEWRDISDEMIARTGGATAFDVTQEQARRMKLRGQRHMTLEEIQAEARVKYTEGTDSLTHLLEYKLEDEDGREKLAGYARIFLQSRQGAIETGHEQRLGYTESPAPAMRRVLRALHTNHHPAFLELATLYQKVVKGEFET